MKKCSHDIQKKLHAKSHVQHVLYSKHYLNLNLNSSISL